MDLSTFLHLILETGIAMTCVLFAVYLHSYKEIFKNDQKKITAGLIVCAAVNAADALAYMLTGLHASAVSILIIACSIICLAAFGTRVHKSLKDMSVQKSFILSGESIESVSGDIDSFLDAIGTGKQNRIRIRFTIEDALIRVWKSLGDPSMVKVTAGIRFNRPGIKIEYEGDSFNPFSKTKNQIDDWSSGLLSSAGLSPDYSYRHGTNMVRIPLARMSVNPIITGLLAILFGIVSGAVAFQLLSPADAQFVTKDLLVPVYDLWNNILFSVSAPAMFVIVMSTMLDTRDISEQGGNSGRILGRFFALMLILGLVTIAVAAPLRAESFSVGELNRYKVAEIISDLFGIIPENLMEPFKNFDTAQLILMGVIFAYAVMAVGDKADGIAAIIRQLNLISTQLAQWIAQLMPLFTVFLSARLVLERNGHLLIGLARVIPFALIMSLFCMTTMILYTCRRMNVYPGTLLRKLKPSFIETLKTGQVAETYTQAEQCCRKQLGIQKIFTQRLLPMGLVLYMPVSMIGMIAFVMYASINSGGMITPMWIIKAIVFALILLVAAPPIPGVNLLSYVVIIGQLEIGREYIIAAMIFDIIFSMFASAANQTLLQTDLILQADRMGLINRNTLTKGDE